jgi:hypothetical protein
VISSAAANRDKKRTRLNTHFVIPTKEESHIIRTFHYGLTSGERTLTSRGCTLTCGEWTLTSGECLLTCGGWTLTSRERPLTSGGRALTSGGCILTCGGCTLTSGECLLTSGERPLTSGERTLTSGGCLLKTLKSPLNGKEIPFWPATCQPIVYCLYAQNARCHNGFCICVFCNKTQ